MRSCPANINKEKQKSVSLNTSFVHCVYCFHIIKYKLYVTKVNRKLSRGNLPSHINNVKLSLFISNILYYCPTVRNVFEKCDKRNTYTSVTNLKYV